MFRSPGALPTFLIIGAMKAGTTSLADLLPRHPDIGMASTKELYYFSPDRKADLRWYAARFRRAARLPARFEATPNYLFHEESVRRIAAELPETTRFVAILRDPVARAYSHYWHSRRIGLVRIGFEEALRHEPEGMIEHPGWWSFVARGRYAEQLTRFCRHIDRSRLLVVFFEELVRDTPAVADRIAAFVGVRPIGSAWGPLPHAHHARRRLVPAAVYFPLVHGPTARRIVPRWVARGIGRLTSVEFKPPPMHPDTRAALAETFRRDNAALAEWLGRDLPPNWTTM